MQRLAVYTVHGEKCYLCTQLLYWRGWDVDHILPESLLKDQEKLKKVRHEFKLPNSFDLNSPKNWLPACKSCNGYKLAMIPEPIPIMHFQLQKAANGSQKVLDMIKRGISDEKKANAASVLGAVFEIDAATILELLEKNKAEIQDGYGFIESERPEENRKKPLQVTRIGDHEIVWGQYGRGTGPSNPSPAMQCPSCGFQFFNGARCVMCGAMDD